MLLLLLFSWWLACSDKCISIMWSILWGFFGLSVSCCFSKGCPKSLPTNYCRYPSNTLFNGWPISIILNFMSCNDFFNHSGTQNFLGSRAEWRLEFTLSTRQQSSLGQISEWIKLGNVAILSSGSSLAFKFVFLVSLRREADIKGHRGVRSSKSSPYQTWHNSIWES